MTRFKTKGVTLLPAFLQKLPQEDQARLKSAGRMEHHPKGSAIQKEGQIPQWQVMINSGHATIEVMGKVLEVVGPGTIFGSTMTCPSPNESTLRALSPVVCMSFEVAVLSEIWTRNPRLLLELLDIAVVRVQSYQVYLHHLHIHNLEIKMAAVLWRVSEPQLDGSRLVPRCITQAILASLLGVSREEINKKKKLLATTQYLITRGTDTYLSELTPMLLASAL